MSMVGERPNTTLTTNALRVGPSSMIANGQASSDDARLWCAVFQRDELADQHGRGGFQIAELHLKVQGVGMNADRRTDDLDRRGLWFSGRVDQMTAIKSEPGAVGEELVGVRVGEPALVVEQLVLHVSDRHGP